MNSETSTPSTLNEIIRQRKTEKVLADPAQPVIYSEEQLADGDQIVSTAIADCGMAPFHFNRNLDGVAEPWRIQRLRYADCRRLATELPNLVSDLRPNNKTAGLLSACSCLIFFTWVPQTAGGDVPSVKLERVNREHHAATAAAVQNFLLLLTAANIRHYWSSGTIFNLHMRDFFGWNDEPRHELMAAIFASYPDGQGEVEIVGGKQRTQRTDPERWFRDITPFAQS